MSAIPPLPEAVAAAKGDLYMIRWRHIFGYEYCTQGHMYSSRTKEVEHTSIMRVLDTMRSSDDWIWLEDALARGEKSQISDLKGWVPIDQGGRLKNTHCLPNYHLKHELVEAKPLGQETKAEKAEKARRRREDAAERAEFEELHRREVFRPSDSYLRAVRWEQRDAELQRIASWTA